MIVKTTVKYWYCKWKNVPGTDISNPPPLQNYIMSLNYDESHQIYLIDHINQWRWYVRMHVYNFISPVNPTWPPCLWLNHLGSQFTCAATESQRGQNSTPVTVYLYRSTHCTGVWHNLSKLVYRRELTNPPMSVLIVMMHQQFSQSVADLGQVGKIFLKNRSRPL